MKFKIKWPNIEESKGTNEELKGFIDHFSREIMRGKIVFETKINNFSLNFCKEKKMAEDRRGFIAEFTKLENSSTTPPAHPAF